MQTIYCGVKGYLSQDGVIDVARSILAGTCKYSHSHPLIAFASVAKYDETSAMRCQDNVLDIFGPTSLEDSFGKLFPSAALYRFEKKNDKISLRSMVVVDYEEFKSIIEKFKVIGGATNFHKVSGKKRKSSESDKIETKKELKLKCSSSSI